MSLGLWIALAAVVIALLFGAYRAFTDGRFLPAGRAGFARDERSRVETNTVASSDTVAEPTTWAALADAARVEPGERATLVQFSSAFCAPCRATRRVLADVADGVPGVVHVELDAEHHLELVRRLGVLRTPTTLILDAEGNEVARAAGAPRKEQVLTALPESLDLA